MLEIVEVRGLLCAGLQDHQLLRFRRAPDHDEVGAIGVRLIELEPAAACHATNTVCDDEVDGVWPSDHFGVYAELRSEALPG